jgi:phosphatidylglycerophosphate synthase
VSAGETIVPQPPVPEPPVPEPLATEPAPLPALSKSSDGPVSLLINRRVSRLFSGPLAAAGVSPNAATLMALAIGLASAAAYAGRWWWLGGVLLQFSSIFSGVDGEIARRTGKGSRYGDFLDTMVDRAAEYLAFLALSPYASAAWGEWAWAAGLLALGGTFLLTSASEKYRSAMHENYPKRQLEPLFAYLASGRDVRIFYLALASIAATWSPDVLFWSLVAIAALMHVNFLWRVLLLRARMR